MGQDKGRGVVKWVTGQGPVVNVHLWSEHFGFLDNPVAMFAWTKVPSHVDTEGINRVDWLVEVGRKSSPLYITVKRPVPHPRMPLHSHRDASSVPCSVTPKTIVCPKRWFQYRISACLSCYSDLFIVFSSGLASPVA